MFRFIGWSICSMTSRLVLVLLPGCILHETVYMDVHELVRENVMELRSS